MTERQRFRVLTPDDLISYETFVMADEQPKTIRASCVLLINEHTGQPLTVHETRLMPLEVPGKTIADDKAKSVCLKCGKVEGVVEDQVVCPEHGDAPCGLLNAQNE